MTHRRTWRATVLAALAAVCLVPAAALAFPESTETQGEMPVDLNGVWLVVHHLTFNRPTPVATPGAEAAATGDSGIRAFNVLNLFKIVHLPKDEAQKARDAREKKQQASVDKAKAIVAKMQEKSVPAQTAEGEVEGGPRVIVPVIPHAPGYDPTAYQGDAVEVYLLDVPMPKSIDDAFQSAQKAEKPFEPTDKQLALLKSSWSSLVPKADTEYSRIEWKVVSKDRFDQSLQLDQNITGAQIAITGTQQMIPRPGQPDRNIVIYGISEAREGLLSGGHVRAMMATAPFPVPIELKGSFKMYKVADLPKPTAESKGKKAAAKKDEPKKDAAPAKAE